MIVRRITRAVIAAVAMAVAAGVIVVAAAYALYALLRDDLTPAGSAAVVATVFAVILVAVGLLTGRSSGPSHAEAEDHAASPQARLLEIARGHPLIALGVALAGAFVVAQRPGLLALLAANLLGAKRQKQRDRRRGL